MAVPRREQPASAPERIGDRYAVEATLGKGGMGAVYRVYDGARDRSLALKQLAVPSHAGAEPTRAARLRFRREFHTMVSLVHPNIVEVFEYGLDRGTPYYTMELLDGQDLADLDRIPMGRACSLLRDVASALAFLHAHRLIHRDLAPRNVRCTSTGKAKLIDFGVLATTGLSDDVAGTPPLIAPEAFYGRPLDHRYDLYGLGALAYRLLTGRHAYPARTIEALPATWRDRPAPPSALAPGIPAALDELVMALLSYDVLARPASAAEVIDRLTSIAELAPLPEAETSRGWIASAALVGRHREVQRIRKAVAAAHAGDGASLLIEAPSGTGKTRMLREVALEAQIAGMTVVRADSDAANRGPYGIVHELARGVISLVPESATRAAQSEHGPVLARVIRPVRDLVEPARPLGDPAEDRIQLQNALAEFFLDAAATHSIALLADDIQRCDEASAAVLATLAYRSAGKQLLVAAALRTDEEVRARAAITSIAEVAERLRLRGLDAEEVTELCVSLFGDVEHVARLARWMHKAAGGSPLYTIELARHLVERGVLRYERGLWTIPGELDHKDLPRGLAEAMDARVRGLSANARALGEALSIHGGELTLELALLLADSRQEDLVFAALDHLAYQEVLVGSGSTWRFRHDGLREALLRGLDDDRRRALHLRVGEALASAPGRTAERDAEIGWHLLRGGDRERGAGLLDAAGRALYDAQSFSDCIPPLEAALEVHEERRGSQRARLELLTMLVMSGTLTDRRVALRHADACHAGLRHWAGIDVMVKVRRFVGRYLAIVVGLAWAFVRWAFTPRRGPNPYLAFSQYVVIVTYTASVYALMFDMANVRRMLRAIEPIAIFKTRVPYAVYLVALNLDDYPRGNLGAVRRHSRQIIEILERDRLTPIRDIDRRALAGAAHYMLAVAAVADVDPNWTQELDELAKIGMRFYDIGAENLRAIFHRLRGEEEAALEIERGVEQMFVQLGSVWQMEALTPITASLAYAFSRDTLGLRRAIDRLSRQIGDGFHFQASLDLARGEYLRAHGDLDDSYDAIVASMAVTDHALFRVAALPALAETELARGNLDRACEIAKDGIALGADLERGGNVNGKLRSVRALALTEAARGDRASAARRLDEAIDEARSRGSPLLSGSLHEARARVALMAEDWPLFRLHAGEADRAYRATRNPVLIGHADRLAQLVTRPATSPPTTEADPVTVSLRGAPEPKSVATHAFATPHESDAASWVSSRLLGCRGRAERAQRLLEVLIDETHGDAGFLFVRAREGVAIAAPMWGEEPASDLVARVEALLTSPTASIANDEWRLILLSPTDGAPNGCVAVRRGSLPPRDPEPDLLGEIARRLEANDGALA